MIEGETLMTILCQSPALILEHTVYFTGIKINCLGLEENYSGALTEHMIYTWFKSDKFTRYGTLAASQLYSWLFFKVNGSNPVTTALTN